MDYFDRPNTNELLEAVSSLIDELNINPKEINNFKIHIALNILNIVRREVAEKDRVEEKFYNLGSIISRKKNFLMEDISKLIKEEKINFKDQTLIDFLHELSLEKIKIDNPKY